MKRKLLSLFFCLSLSLAALALGAWTQKADFGGTSRYGAAGFSIAAKAYIGTGMDGSLKKDFWEWDQATNTWTQKADFGGAARYSAIGFSIGTKGYIGTGMDGTSTRRKDFWEWDQSTNTWSQKADFGGTAREGAVGFSIGTKGYIGTGQESSSVYKKDFWEWDQGTNTWSAKTNFSGTARTVAVGFSIGTKGYIGTGVETSGTVKKDFWEWDQSGNSWTQKSDFGGVARFSATGFCIGALAYIGLGRDGSLAYKADFWEWNQNNNTWTSISNFGGTARNGAAGISLGNRGYFAGGYDGIYKKDFWEWNTLPSVFISAATTVCSGQCNGSASSTASGGTPPYTYLWSNAETTSAATGLCAGNNTLTVTDADGDTAIATVIVDQNPSPTSSATSTPVSCFGGNNGGATILPGGGTPAYTFLWSNGETTTQISGLTAQAYSVIVTDANNCSDTSMVSVTEPPLLTSPIVSQTNILCAGGSGGSADVSAAGGTPAYTYLWDNGQTASSVTGLSAGNYSVTVSDANNCSSSATVSITQPAALSLSLTVNTATCLYANGSALPSLSGGVPSYTYSWNNGISAANATGLYAGSYTLTATDANGCTTTGMANVTNVGGDSVFITSSANVLCHGGSTGSATCTILGTNAPHTYSWNTVPSQAAPVATGLSAGLYNITITDSVGCIDIASVTITEPTSITAISSVSNISCQGGNDGSAALSVSGGVAGYTYSWSSGETTASATGLVAGGYSVTVTDSNGCTDTALVQITEPQMLVVSTNTVSPVCAGSCVTLSATSSGGNPGHSYLWQPGNNTSSVITICATTSSGYTVTVNDSKSCMDTASAYIPVNDLPLASLLLEPDTICINSPPVTLAGGTPSGGIYSGPGVSGGSFDPAAAGNGFSTITYTYTDSNGCTDSSSAQVFVDLCTGIQRLLIPESPFFYPNPGTGMFSADLTRSQGEVILLDIFDVVGEKVLHMTLEETHTAINLTDRPKGMYLYQFRSESSGKMSGSGKLIIH